MRQHIRYSNSDGDRTLAGRARLGGMERKGMAKRLTLVAYDALSVIVLACLLSCAVVVPAYAYIDPSVMTYTIQAVAGVAVALSTLAGVALRRGRKTLMR